MNKNILFESISYTKPYFWTKLLHVGYMLKCSAKPVPQTILIDALYSLKRFMAEEGNLWNAPGSL